MDEHNKTAEQGQDRGNGNANGNGNGNGNGPQAKEFKFTVDGRPFETEHAHLTGLQLKALASVDATFGVFLEARGQDSDRQIGDGDVVDLAAPGKERFYTTPPATYGTHAAGGRAAAGETAPTPVR